MKKIRKPFIIIIFLYAILFLIIIGQNFFDKTVNSNNSSDIVIKENYETNKKIALTFDDGPNSKYTEEILDVLKERGVVATFFLIGKNIEGNEKLVKRMSDEGHLIGNHTYSHVNLALLSKKNAMIEIIKNNRLIYSITGKKVKYIRPPFGEWNESLSSVCGLNVIMWDIDPKDWCIFDTECIVDHVISHADDGYIILLHDSYETTVEATMQIVDYLISEGYEFVTIDKLIKSSEK